MDDRIDEIIGEEGIESDAEEAEAEAEPTVLDDIDEEWHEDSKRTKWSDMIPDWNPRSSKYGVYPFKDWNREHGLVIAAIGHKSGGKTTAFRQLCAEHLIHYIDRAIGVSSTDAKNRALSGNGVGRGAIIHPVYIHTEPTMQTVRYVNKLCVEEMRMYRKYHKKLGYRQKRTCFFMDDAGYAADVLQRRSPEMINMWTNARHLALYFLVALQSVGLLTRQLRLNVDVVIVVREHGGEALGSLYDSLFKKNTPLGPNVFREIMDDVCIPGRRVLIFDNRSGRLFKWTIRQLPNIPRPMGNHAWLAWAERNQKKEKYTLHPRRTLLQLATERMMEDVKPRPGVKPTRKRNKTKV